MAEAEVTIYVITYRRSRLLRRALESLRQQTYRHWRAYVINDDPSDGEVQQILNELDDGRISPFDPARHRGGTKNFSLAFAEGSVGLVSVLEDDNWWQPEFLEEMVEALASHPDVTRAVCNERIWRETSSGEFVDTGRMTLELEGVRVRRYEIEDLCGSALWCNSAMLIRARPTEFTAPTSIPVDVTEHYRDRSVSGPILQLGRPLVNYSETIASARSRGHAWGVHQCLLVGSVFAALPVSGSREALAKLLWSECHPATSPRAVTLVTTGLFVPSARVLLRTAPLMSILRSCLWAARNLRALVAFSRMRHEHELEFAFLRDAPLTREVVQRFARNHPDSVGQH